MVELVHLCVNSKFFQINLGSWGSRTLKSHQVSILCFFFLTFIFEHLKQVPRYLQLLWRTGCNSNLLIEKLQRCFCGLQNFSQLSVGMEVYRILIFG